MIEFRKIFQPKNRVLLLDVIIFFVNFILMTVLVWVLLQQSPLGYNPPSS